MIKRKLQRHTLSLRSVLTLLAVPAVCSGPFENQMAMTFGMLEQFKRQTQIPTTEPATLQINAVASAVQVLILNVPFYSTVRDAVNEGEFPASRQDRQPMRPELGVG